MLIDRIKKLQPDFHLPHMDFKLRDAIVFYIDESPATMWVIENVIK